MNTISTEVLVIGAGPGGYSAAFRAADLGKQVVLVDERDGLGGVCLNVGCIPSKALLHAAKLIDDSKDADLCGISFAPPKVDVPKLKTWKDSIVKKLTGGLFALAKQRKVQFVSGAAQFINSNEIEVTKGSEKTKIQFKEAIIAVGSTPVKLPFIPEDSRIFDSTGALELNHVKGDMLILGGGIIGLEMATVYHALGVKIHVVEMQDQIIPGADADVVKPLFLRMKKQYANIYLKTSVTKVEAKADGLYVTFQGAEAPQQPQRYDSILVAVGRKPNGKFIAAEKAGVKVDDRGFIAVDNQMRTNVANIFAIGDVIGNPMLAHKSVAEGRIAAEVIAGKKHFFAAKCIPSVAYTDPEIAWVGLTEREAQAKGIQYGKGVFPWAASGRALSMNRSEGMTKVIFDEKTHRLLGAGIVGVNAGELIAELALAIEMGCVDEDIALTIHAHPTLAESVMMATEIFEGTITDLYLPKKKLEG